MLAAQKPAWLCIAVTVASAIAGCGASPVVTAPSDSTSLRFRPETGARYRAHFRVDTSVPRGQGRIRVTSDVTLQVAGVEPAFTTLHAHIDREALELPDNLVRLPALPAPTRPETDVRLDERGRPIGSPLVITGAVTAALGGYTWGAPAMPVHRVRVGESWPVPRGFSWLGQNLVEGTLEGSFRLEEVDGERARVSWTIRAGLAPVDNAGTPIRGQLTIEGSSWLMIADGVPRRGSERATARWENGDEAITRYQPSSIERSWCITRQGEPACPPDADEADTRPVAHAYEGDACTSRVEGLRTSFASLPTGPYEVAPADALATVERGTEAIAASLFRIGIGRDGSLTFEDRPIENTTTILERIQIMRGNYPDLHDGEPFPERVRVIVPADAPLSAVVPVLKELGRTLTLELLVDTGRRREVPPAPAWVEAALGGGDAEERRAAGDRALGAAIAGCVPLFVPFGAMSNFDEIERERRMRPEIADHIAACRCGGVDIDALESMLVRVANGAGDGLAVLVMPRGAGGAIVHLPRTSTMTDLARALANRRTPGSAMRVRLR